MLATGLAVAALEEGGATFLGRHWCARHDECLAGETPAARYAEIIQRLAKRVPGRETDGPAATEGEP